MSFGHFKLLPRGFSICKMGSLVRLLGLNPLLEKLSGGGGSHTWIQMYSVGFEPRSGWTWIYTKCQTTPLPPGRSPAGIQPLSCSQWLAGHGHLVGELHQLGSL